MLQRIISYSLILIFFSLHFNALSNPKIDSLQKLLARQKEDSSKVKTLWKLCILSRKDSFEKALDYGNKALNLARKLNAEKAISNSYFILGETYADNGDFKQGILMLQKAIESTKDSSIQSKAMNSLANAYQNSGNLNESYVWNKKCLELAEKINNQPLVASSLGNLGTTYLFLSQPSKALDYYLQARKIFEEIRDNNGLSVCYSNIGVIYEGMNDFEKAMEYNQKSLALDLKSGSMDGLAASYGNMAILFYKQRKFKESYEAHSKSLYYYKKINYKLEAAREMVNIYNLHFTLYDSIYSGKEQENNYKALMDSLKALMPTLIEANDKTFGTILLSTLAGIQIKLKNYDKAENNIELGLKFANEINAKNRELEFYQLLVLLYTKKGDYKKALELQHKYTELYKTYTDLNLAAEISGKDMLFSFNKKVLADSLKNEADKKLKDEEIKNGQLKLNQEKMIKYSLFGGFSIVLIFSILLFKRFKITTKQKAVIEEQKKMVEEKQQAIVDSINYAKRIQKAFMSNEKYIDKKLKDLM